MIEITDPVESACPYLAERTMRLAAGMAFHQLEPRAFDRLLRLGYRRTGLMLYRPDCPGGCRECVPLRVPLDTLRLSRSQRRVLGRVGNQVTVHVRPPVFEQAYVELHNRHALQVSKNNRLCSAAEYATAFLDTCVVTHLLEYRLDGRLVGLSTLDEGDEACSSVYFCWDPDYARHSLGTFSALWEMAWARERNKAFYYLGYWIKECRSMSYKDRFRPHERLDWATGRWLPVGPAEGPGIKR